MARILIVGGHGNVALLLAPLLTSRGDHVTSVIRNPDHEADVAATRAVPLVVDIERLDTDQWANLVSGHDAVVWAAGAGGGNAARTYAVDRDAAVRSIDAAAQVGVRRYAMVSYFGSRRDHGVPEDSSFFAYAQAKAAADEHLRASGLDWTILAPSSLTFDPPTGRIEVDPPESGSVSRADVAGVAAAALEDPGTIGRTVAFNSGDTPIMVALAQLSGH